jgi:hypothetical protein
MSDHEEISLPQAALELGIGYLSARHLVLTRALDARQVYGRWVVDRASVERLKRERGVPAMGATKDALIVG